MAPPIVELNDATVLVNGRLPASELFTAFDPDDQIVEYTIYDFRGGGGTGFFQRDGFAYANGSSFTFPASELSRIEYVGGTDVRFEGFKIIAKDEAGNFSSPLIRGRIYSVRANTTQPHVKAPVFTVLANEELPGSDFVTGFDPDGYPLTHYRITEGSKLLRVRSADNWINVTGYIHRFTSGETVTLTGAAEEVYNVTGVVEVLTEHEFRISAPGILTGEATGSSLLAYSNDDTSGFQVGGVQIPKGVPHTITAEEVNDLTYYAEGGDDLENFYIQGFDGSQWSFDKRGLAGTRINANFPVVQLTTVTVPPNERVGIEDSVSVVDADGNTMKKYRFYNTSPHGIKGELYRGAAQMPRLQWFEVDAADLSTVSFETNFEFDQQQIRIRAYDGLRWSAPGTLVISTSATFTDGDFEFSDLTSPIYVMEQRISLPLSSVINQRASSAGNFEQVQVFEPTTDVRFGNLRNIDDPLPGGTIYQFTEQQFETQVNYYSGEFLARHLDTVYVRKEDANGWTPWKKFDIRTEPEVDDVLTSGTDWNGFLPRTSTGKLEFTYSFIQGGLIFSDLQRQNTRAVFRHMEEFLNVQFIEVPDSIGGGGTFRFDNFIDDIAPIPIYVANNTADAIPGDTSFNLFALGSLASTEFEPGTFGHRILMQAIGYTMGLKYPDAGSPLLPPETSFTDFTVMSRRGPIEAEPTTYQLYDIVELQDVYGANTDTRTGNDTYSIWAHWDSRTQFVETIWDAGGNDTLSGVGSVTPVTIDLRPGLQSSIGELTNNVNIAFNVEIENAIGSSNGDTLIGNALNNVLIGGAGNDTLFGNTGVDVLRGGAGDDIYQWGVGDQSDTIDEQDFGGTDTLELTNFPTFDSLTDDLEFYRREDDLYIDLGLEGGEQEARMKITNQVVDGSRVETLELMGQRIDLVNLTSFLVPGGDPIRFEIASATSSFGNLVTPV